MSDSESKVKVTDKRMFTADGELREDYRHLDSAPEDVVAEPASSVEPEAASAEPAAPAAPATPAAPAAPAAPAPDVRPDVPPAMDPLSGQGRLPANPSFLDLLGVLAEPIALFLGDARLPDGRSAEDLEAARFHIDLLAVIEQKSVGNLSAEESALLEDLLYRLRLRYVQKTG